MTLHENNIITSSDLQLREHQGKENDSDETPGLSLDPTLNEKEKEVIQQALEKTRYNKTAAAKLLGISFRALRYRLKKLGME